MKIAAIQIQSILDPEINLTKIRKFLNEERAKEVEAVFLPEAFYSMSDGTKPTPYLVEEGNEHFHNIQKIATDFNVYLLGGSAATNVNGKIINRTYNFTPQGVPLIQYDKINLFSCDLSKHSSNTVLDEAKVYTPGHTPRLIQVGEWNLGLAICFDLRFPELFRSYSAAGANLLSISSAFTVPTGKAHWHTLVRARAIENQCYVVAAAQWGKHNEKLSTFGHSLIIDPWGEILTDGGEGEAMIIADLTIERVRSVREGIDVLRSPNRWTIYKG